MSNKPTSTPDPELPFSNMSDMYTDSSVPEPTTPSAGTPTPPSPGSLAKALDQDLLSSMNDALTDANPAQIDIKSFFSFLNLGGMNQDAYKHIKLDEETAMRMRNHMISMKHGTYAAVPLICQGYEKCPIKHHCWFAKRLANGKLDAANSEFPMLQPCPVETSVIQLKVQQYVSEFVGDMNISVTPTTLALITKLAEIDIYEIRCDMILSSGDRNGQGMDMLVNTVEAINEKTGDVIHGVKEHPILSVKDRLQKQRDKLLKQLLATPEAKINASAKLIQTGSTDIASQLTSMNNMLASMKDKALNRNTIENPNAQYGNPNLSYLNED